METPKFKMFVVLKNAGASEKKALGGSSAIGELFRGIDCLKRGHRITHWLVSINIVLMLCSLKYLEKMIFFQ